MRARKLIFGCAVSALLALVLSGCADSDRQKIVGVWEIETAEKLIDRIGSEDSMLEDSDGSPMTIAFERNGNLTTTTKVGAVGKTKTGSWEMIRSEADQSVVRCTLMDSHMGSQTTELEIEWIDTDTIKMTPPNMAGLKMKLRFLRKAK